jgi:uncharacterized protein GlcG (DUF336 family)
VITLALAARMTQAAVDRAAEIGALVSAAVGGPGGRRVHVPRMGKARIGRAAQARHKA